MVQTQRSQRALEAPLHQSGYARIRLDHQDHPVALRGQIANRLSKPGPAEGSPVEVIDAALECGFESSRRHAIAGRHTETADAQSGSAEYCVLKSSAGRSHVHDSLGSTIHDWRGRIGLALARGPVVYISYTTRRIRRNMSRPCH